MNTDGRISGVKTGLLAAKQRFCFGAKPPYGLESFRPIHRKLKALSALTSIQVQTNPVCEDIP